MRFLTGYNKIKSTNEHDASNHIRKLYLILIGIIGTCICVFIFYSIHSDEKSSKSALEPNIDPQTIENIVIDKDGEAIGHILSCPTCCDPQIDFDEWLKESPSNTEYNLLQSHYLTRHGARTQCFQWSCWTQPYSEWNCLQNDIETIKLKPDSPYKFQLHSINSTQVIPGNCMIGQLTPYGYQQLFQYGSQLIKRYSDYYKLIPHTLNNSTVKHIVKQIKLRADNIDRVQQSVMALFDGMYHSYDTKSISAINIKIPLYFEDPNYEIITMTDSLVCPSLNDIREDRINSEMYLNVSMTLMYELNQTAMYLLDNDQASYVDLFDCGTSYLCHNAPAPFNVTQDIYDAAQELYTWRFYYQGVYPDYVTATKYHIGPLLKLIYIRFKYMIEKKEGNKNTQFVSKLYVYGGHDTGPIAPLLSAFEYNLTETWIPYAAAISMELFQRKQDLSYWILVSYNGNKLLLPRCEREWSDVDSKLCEWSKFEAWMLEVIPDGIDECPNMKIEQYLSQNT